MVDVNYFLSLYPQFSVVDYHVIQHQLNAAENNYCISWPEPKKTQGIMLVAAHHLTIEWLQQVEVVSSASVVVEGSKINALSPKKIDWNLTTYGWQYLSLSETIYTPPILIL